MIYGVLLCDSTASSTETLTALTGLAVPSQLDVDRADIRQTDLKVRTEKLAAVCAEWTKGLQPTGAAETGCVRQLTLAARHASVRPHKTLSPSHGVGSDQNGLERHDGY